MVEVVVVRVVAVVVVVSQKATAHLSFVLNKTPQWPLIAACHAKMCKAVEYLCLSDCI